MNHPEALPEIWSYGHRNPQGLAIHPETGDVWATEHGPQGGDELNVILPGRNYGWPVIGYGVNYRTGIPIHESPARVGMEQPRTFWLPSIGASGLMIYDGDFPWDVRIEKFLKALVDEGHETSLVARNREGRRTPDLSLSSAR